MKLATFTVLLVASWFPARHALCQETPGPEAGAAGQEMVQPYSVYSSGLFEEVYIDEEGELYKTRPYQGVVPSRDADRVTEAAAVTEPPEGSRKTRIAWIGFEQRELFSRVFILADQVISPWVYDNFVQAQGDAKISPKIFVELNHASIPLKNNRRPLVTRSFNTPIAVIEAKETKDGVKLEITLKKEARYLPVQGGKIFYVDVEK